MNSCDKRGHIPSPSDIGLCAICGNRIPYQLPKFYEIDRELQQRLAAAEALVIDRWTSEQQSSIDRIVQAHIDDVNKRLAAAEAELDEVKRILSIGVGRDEQTLAFIIDKQRTRIVELLEAAKEVGCEH